MDRHHDTPAAAGGARGCPLRAEAHPDGLVHVFNGRGAGQRHTVMTPEQARGIAARLLRAADQAQAGSASNTGRA